MMILLGAALCVVTCIAWGALLLRALRVTLTREEEFFFSFVTGSVPVSLLVFGLAAIHQARKGVFIALAAVSVIVWQRFRQFRPPMKSAPVRFRWLFIPLFATFGFMYLINAMAPEISTDGGTY